MNLRKRRERTTGSMVAGGRDVVAPEPGRLVVSCTAAGALAVLVAGVEAIGR